MSSKVYLIIILFIIGLTKNHLSIIFHNYSYLVFIKTKLNLASKLMLYLTITVQYMSNT